MYFFEQLGSGHSSNTGEDGGLLFAPDGAGGGGTLVFFAVLGDSSSGERPFLLLLVSGLGETKGVGEPVPAVPAPELLEPLAAPRLPLAPPFLSLLCTEDRVSVKLLKSPPGVVLAAARPLFPLPLGVLASKSLVGESQNLGGAQSCRVQSNSVPT